MLICLYVLYYVYLLMANKWMMMMHHMIAIMLEQIMICVDILLPSESSRTIISNNVEPLYLNYFRKASQHTENYHMTQR